MQATLTWGTLLIVLTLIGCTYIIRLEMQQLQRLLKQRIFPDDSPPSPADEIIPGLYVPSIDPVSQRPRMTLAEDLIPFDTGTPERIAESNEEIENLRSRSQFARMRRYE